MDIAKFIEEIKAMTVVELNDLVKAIETEFGVSAAAPVAVAAAGGQAEQEQQTENHTEQASEFFHFSSSNTCFMSA